MARESELRQLDGYLHQALNGHGRAIFVTGEAGQGKTALIQAFAQRAQDACPDLVVGGGNCNAYTGLGDPYLPFREILAMLTADIDTRVAAGAIGHEHARRLRRTLPLTAQALLRDGADLIVSSFPARRCCGAPSPVYPRTEVGSIGCKSSWNFRRPAHEDEAGRLEQYTLVLQALARQVPLLLVLDDLQWADLGSISLLFHLGRRLEGSPILVLGAYRPEEVALGRNGERHPVEPVVNEFKRAWGEIEIALGQSEGRHFVSGLLDSEPSLSGPTPGFATCSTKQTRGHPLFTVELLRRDAGAGRLGPGPGGLLGGGAEAQLGDTARLASRP